MLSSSKDKEICGECGAEKVPHPSIKYLTHPPQPFMVCFHCMKKNDELMLRSGYNTLT